MKRIADDPARLKLCGPCGLELPVSDFHPNMKGYPSAECKDCHRARAREDYRNRYRNRPEFREAEKARRRKCGPGALDAGAMVRLCRCHGKVCWIRNDDAVLCRVTAERANGWAVVRARGAA